LPTESQKTNLQIREGLWTYCKFSNLNISHVRVAVHMSDLDEFSKLSHRGDPWQRNNEVGVDIGVNPDAHQLIEIHILVFHLCAQGCIGLRIWVYDKRGWMDRVADFQVQNQNPNFLFFIFLKVPTI
jgi:hypothetical protein